MSDECVWERWTYWLDGRDDRCTVHGEVRITEWDIVNERVSITAPSASTEEATGR